MNEATREPSRFAYPIASSTLSRRAYVGLMAATVLLVGLQFLVTPRFLGATQFGIFALGLSAFQAFIQFGDLGFSNAASRTGLSPIFRANLRESAYTIATFCLLVVQALLLLAVFFLGLSEALYGAVAFSVLGGWFCIAGKIRTNARMEAQDEVGVAVSGLVWQNSQKIGQIIGMVSGNAVVACGLGALTAILSGPLLPRLRPNMNFVRTTYSLWGSGLILVSSAFAMTWADTYVVSGIMGLAESGAYQAVARPLSGVTYLYLPAVALIQVAANGSDLRRLKRLIGVALFGTLLALTIVAAGLIIAGPVIWPEYVFPAALVVVCSVASLLSCVSATCGVLMITNGRQSLAALSNALGVVILLAMAIWLVPLFGLVGVGLASALGWLIPASVQLGYCAAEIGSR